MKDNLKEFVDRHRRDFDDQVPPEVWAAISSGIQAPSSTFINLKKLAKMFKYSIGASALIIGTYFMFHSLNTAQLSVHTPEAKLTQLNIKTTETNEPETEKPVGNAALASGETKTNTSKSTKPLNAKLMKAPEAQGIAPSSSEKTTSANRPFLNASMISHPAQASHPDSMSELSPDSNSVYAVDTLFKGIKNLIVKGNHASVKIIGKDQEAVSLKGNVSRKFGELITRKGFNKQTRQNTRERIKFSVQESTLTVWVESEVLSKNAKIEDKVKGAQGLFFEVPIHTHIVVDENSGNVNVTNISDSILTLHSTFGSITAENVNADLFITAHSGDITLNTITGFVNCVSSFGKQNLLQIKGDIKTRSSSGELFIKSLNGNAEATSTFGSQKFENVSGAIKCTTTSGNIEVEHLNGNLSSRSTFGDQDLDDVNGTILATASSGDIDLEDAKGSFTLTTTFGNIRGTNLTLLNNCNFTTSSGNISMQVSNDLSELSFDLSSSSGDLHIKKGDAELNSEKKLTLDKGPIKIKGVSSFGDQNYK